MTILILEYLKIEIKEKNPAFIHNLFTIACIVGILHSMWQINTCFQFDKFVSYLEKLMDTSPNHIIQMPIYEHYFANKEIPEDFYKKLKVQERFYSPFGIVHQSILLNEENKIDKIIVPKDDKQWLSDFEVNKFYTVIQAAHFEHRHKEYIDVSEIVKYIEDYKFSKE